MSSCFGIRSRVLPAAACAALLASALSAQNDKRFFVGPSTRGGLDDYVKLFAPGADWDWVQRQGTVFELHNNSLIPNPSNPEYLEDTILENAARMLNGTGLGVGVIAGGLRPVLGTSDPSQWANAGELTAKSEFPGFRRWADFEGRIDVLMLDSPFSKMLNATDMPWSVAAGELADYLDRFQSTFPTAEWGFMEPIPRYTIDGYQTFNQIDFGDFRELIDTVLPILQARGHEPSFFLADSPYRFNEGTQDGWDKLVAVQDLIHSKGLRFGWFINDDLPPGSTDQQYYANSLAGLRSFRLAGGNPDDYNFRSWYEYPALAVPESEPYSFTWMVRGLMGEVFGKTVAPNVHNVSLTFDDGQLGELQLESGTVRVQNGRVEVTSDTEFSLHGQVYDEPGVAIGGDMSGMPYGSEVAVTMAPRQGSFDYHVVLVADAGLYGHVELRAVHKTLGTVSLLDSGPKFFLTAPKWAYHMSMRTSGGVLDVNVNRLPALNVASPLPADADASLGVLVSNPIAYVSSINVDYFDVREKLATTSVSLDGNNYIVLSIFQPGLKNTFDQQYFLNSLAGSVLDFSGFSLIMLPYLQFQKVYDDYVLMRSTFPVVDGTIVGLVYDGDFETERVQ